MADASTDNAKGPSKKSKAPILMSGALALVGASAGFFAVESGSVATNPFSGHGVENHGDPGAHDQAGHDIGAIEFVQVPAIVVSYTAGGRREVLRFAAQLEVEDARKSDVENVLPRIVDVLNGYLRALELSDIDDPMALTRIRAHMLRRIQIVTGPDAVRDLLIMEFVLT